MENLLLMGIDTRPMVNSALKLDYRSFSISYFKTVDFKRPYAEKHVLDQKSVTSCDRFEENYSKEKLFELFEDLIGELDENENEKSCKAGDDSKFELDKIVLSTGLNACDFSGKFKKYRKLVRGNKNTENVENKFKFYNKLKNKFNVPLTFKPSDIYELNEILQQYNRNQFILKPLQGSGGLGIFMLNNESLTENKMMNSILENISYENHIVQEYNEGTNVSSSVLSSRNERKNLINTRLITEHDLGNSSFEYSGNILPLDENSLRMFNKQTDIANRKENRNGIRKYSPNIKKMNEEMKNTSEDLIKEFKLIGSNGVDFILGNDGELKVIEINPRLQGTYELVEKAMNINLLDAHIKACEGELIEIPPIERYALKKIIYARRPVLIGNLNIQNVYDVPYEGVKIEKDQPLVTLISSSNDLNKATEDLKIAEREVYKNIS